VTVAIAVIVPKTVLAILSSTPRTRRPALREMRVRSDRAVAIVHNNVVAEERPDIVLSG
jgi:hypothetical protein